MNEFNLKKSSVLGSNAFNFIANMVSKSISQESSGCTSNERPTENIPDLNQFIKLEIKTNTETEPNSVNMSEKDSNFCLKNETKTEDLNPETKESIFCELLSVSAADQYAKENFLKGCKWSPDGTCIVTNSDDSFLRIYDTSAEMLNLNKEEKPNEIKPSLKLEEPALIYDYAWYPFMSSSNPDTACLFSTCKENPVHLFDAYTGKIRCSYMGYNHLDELETAYCIAFNSDCTQMYCGYNRCIKVFDISRPGKNYKDIQINKGQYKLPGIVSTISFSPKSDVYAVGTYSKFIGIYVTETNEPVCIIESHMGGLTHLLFSQDGNRLFSGGRKDNLIYCWDVRNPGKVLQVFKRDVQTNQRIYFDLYADKHLCSGNNNGVVSIWDANDFDVSVESQPEFYSFKAHSDCTNGISFNMPYSLLATSSGQRKIFKNNKKSKDPSSSSDSEGDDDADQTFENSLKIWKYC